MGKRTNNNRIKELNKQGFTLLETIVAIAILTLAIMGPLELAVRSIGMAGISKNQIVAFYLAQDAMEYIKNVRDANFLTAGNNWLDGLSFCVSADGNTSCNVDVPNSVISACSGTCEVLRYSNSEHYYSYSPTSEASVFTRTVKITSPVGGNNNEAKVQVILSWREKTGQKDFTIEDNIFNWK
jgi:prepilin-type N-terminal cleavage/methylation domain-containing protein